MDWLGDWLRQVCGLGCPGRGGVSFEILDPQYPWWRNTPRKGGQVARGRSPVGQGGLFGREEASLGGRGQRLLDRQDSLKK